MLEGLEVEEKGAPGESETVVLAAAWSREEELAKSSGHRRVGRHRILKTLKMTVYLILRKGKPNACNQGARCSGVCFRRATWL